MSNKKAIVAITGGNGSGKTTQCKMLISFLTKLDKTEPIVEYRDTQDKNFEYCYTIYPDSGVVVLGKMGDNQCTGLDAVYSKLGADGVTRTLKKVLSDERASIVIVECVFFTFKWYENWIKAGLRNKFNFAIAHLDQTLWENFNRIQQRRFNKNPSTYKGWWEVPLEDTVYKNVGSKNSETRRIFEKIAGNDEKYPTTPANVAVKLNAQASQIKINNEIIKALYELFNLD